MADRYAVEQQGVADGTSIPAKKLDGTVIGAKERSIRATLPGVTLNIADRLYLGRFPLGAVPLSISGNVDTSLGSATLSIGTTAVPAKYVAAKTLTATDANTGLGPKASARILAPLDAGEDIWLTVGGAAIPGSVVGSINLTYTVSA